MNQKIILDTNAVMAISQFKIDLFSQLQELCDFTYQLSVLQGTIEELQQIMAQQRSKYKRAAKLALQLLSAKSVYVIPSSGAVDEELVKHSQQGDIVLTQDIALKKRLKRPYLTIRQKKYVKMVR